jgi:hypothetical protein
MNTIHDTDITFVHTSSPPQMQASGEKTWGPGEKKLTRGETIEGTKSFSQQNMRFHFQKTLKKLLTD